MFGAGDQNSLSLKPEAGAQIPFGWIFSVYMLVSMLGSFALMLPTSWVYMATRQKKGFDQSMVQTLIILAMAVTGVVVIVRNSLALAFSLAGIASAALPQFAARYARRSTCSSPLGSDSSGVEAWARRGASVALNYTAVLNRPTTACASRASPRARYCSPPGAHLE
jgi:hypothetical protein